MKKFQLDSITHSFYLGRDEIFSKILLTIVNNYLNF